MSFGGPLMPSDGRANAAYGTTSHYHQA